MVDARRLAVGAVSAVVAAGGAVATGKAAVRRARRRDDPRSGEDFVTLDDLDPPVRDRWVVGRDGADLHLLSAGHGRPIVLLHGVTLQAGAWRYQFALADRGEVLSLDQRGHGRSRAGRDGYGLDRLADDLADVLAALDLRGALLVGHSMGGMAIMRFTHRHADVMAARVAGLAFVSTSADPVLGLGTAASLRGVASVIQAPLGRIGWKRVPTYRPGDSDLHFGLVRLSFGDDAPPHLVEATRRMVAAMDAEALNRSFLGLLANDEHAHLGAVAVPTIVVVGSRDLLTPPRAARRIAEAVPGAELHVVAGAGHQLMMERPHELNGLLRGLLDELDAVDRARATAAADVRVALTTLPPADVGRQTAGVTDATPTAPKDATEHTRAVLAAATMPLDDGDADRVRRGFVAAHATGRIEGELGVAWDSNRYDFISFDAACPPTVHPSLWRQAQLNAVHGLFEVAPGVWQARSYDISNITFIAGDEGWIVIDPLTGEATARACLELANEHLGARPVTAVIYTHSHGDHFGGVHGVTTPADVAAGRCRVIAPEGFMHETVAENVIAGPAMARRTIYQFGTSLPAGPRGHVDCGLGKAIPLVQPGLIAPTEDITHTGQELMVDGVRIVFQLTPETEAPAEMNFFFPDRGWLCMAENCSHNMHNLVPVRGAQVRDALAWSKYIGEAIELFGAQTQLMFASHHWPRWGGGEVRDFLTLQRDLYRWLHDQTMRLANKGFTPNEIAERMSVPPEFAAHGHTRGYYGHLTHNVKAVYQRYLSWYDGNPARLQAHEPVEAGRRYVAFMGGAESLLAQARRSFDEGDYRWVAEVVNHLVFAEPGNVAARELQADALEQLGYQCESATFRNSYLVAAQELRKGPPPARNVRRRGLLDALSTEQLFDTIAVRLKAEELGGVAVRINWRFTDVGEDWVVGVSNRALYSVAGRHDPAADVTVTLTRSRFVSVFAGEGTFVEGVTAGEIVLEGDAGALLTVFGNLDVFESGFPIVEP